MTNNKFRGDGASMKKIALVAFLAVFVVMMTASLAYADTFSDYAGWSTAGDNGTVPTPHKGFQTTTVKCAVCHAVHKGTDGGEALLRDTITGACEYCHISNFIGNFKIYNGATSNYSGLDLTTAHNGSTGAACVDCHAVHGAGTITNANFTDVTSKILKSAPGIGVQTGLPASYAVSSGTVRDGVITSFCTGCHPYYQDAYNGTAAGSFGVGTYQSHIMGAANASYLNGSASYTGRVANVASSYCRSCHDAGATGESATNAPGDAYSSSSNFPHFTSGNSRFLSAALYDGATVEGVTNASADGVCLKCHSWNLGADGAGVDY
jgi:hypothetical protein